MHDPTGVPRALKQARDAEQPQPADMFDWVRVIDGIKFGASVKGIAAKTIKLVAYRLAMFGDPDGSNVRPGPARIAAVCEVDYTTAKKVFGLLRDWGLIVKVSGRRGLAVEGKHVGDVYQLTVPPDLFERFHHRSPDELRREVEEIQAKNRRIVGGKPQPVDNPELRVNRPPVTPSAVDAAEARVTGESGVRESQLRVNPDVSYGGTEPAIPTSDLPPTSTNHDHSFDRDSLPSTGDLIEDPNFELDEPEPIGALLGGLPLRSSSCGNPICHGGVLKIGINRRPCTRCSELQTVGESL